MNKLSAAVKTPLKNVLFGFITGSSMMLPGVSGGTTAIILGIYDRLIAAVSGLFRDFRRNALFLAEFGLGAAAGFFLLAKLIGGAIEYFGVPMTFLFIGLIIGTVPILYKEAAASGNSADTKVKPRLKPTDIIFAAAGAAGVFALRFLPENIFVFDGGIGLAECAVLFVTGIFVSVALVLPGISTSSTLLILGVYTPLVAAINGRDLLFIAPLGIGLLAGIFLTTGILEFCMKRFARPTYMIISGFVLGSVFELFTGIPELPAMPYLLLCPIMLIVGFTATFLISLREKKASE